MKITEKSKLTLLYGGVLSVLCGITQFCFIYAMICGLDDKPLVLPCTIVGTISMFATFVVIVLNIRILISQPKRISMIGWELAMILPGTLVIFIICAILADKLTANW